MASIKKRTLKKKESIATVFKEIKRDKFLYILIAPAIICAVLFHYVPLYGVTIAFKDYNIFNPAASPWVGFDNFKAIFSNPEFFDAIITTIKISLLNIIITFPAGIIFALLINEVHSKGLKKFTQTISYLPHFLSWISVIGIASTLYSKSGIINDLFVMMSGGTFERKIFLSIPQFFIPNIIILSLWKGVGWNSIVFIAAITGVDESLYEAASIDGAKRFKQVIHITIPSILPTIVIMLLWKIGAMFSDNFELTYGLQNAFIDTEVIQTLIYKQGIQGGNYKMTTAFGLFQGVVNFILLVIANTFAKKTTEVGIF